MNLQKTTISSTVWMSSLAVVTALFGNVLLKIDPTIAAEPPSEQTNVLVSSDSALSGTGSMEAVTSVSQLSDVKPTDWAFQALQSLVERYGCIAGYPDKTYRGNRAMTRYEFAAGLNSCMDRVNDLIAASTADMVKKEDLATLRKLQEQFAAELATLRGRVDGLESKVATLEKQQFSTTTKLSGEAIFSLASGYGGKQDANVVFNNRVRLNLTTSFTGKDMLITGLQAYNFSDNNLASTMGLADPLKSSSNVRLGYEPQFPSTNPAIANSKRGGNNQVELYKLLYIFPVSNKLTAFVGTQAEVSDAFPAILPFAGEGTEGISRFSTLPAAQRISGGTSQFGLASAAGLIYNISDKIDLRALYGTLSANLTNNTTGAQLGAGLFNGSYVAAAQLTVKPSKALDIGINYAYSYHQINILGAGLGSSDIGAVNIGAGSLIEPIKMNTFGISAAYRLNPSVTLAASYTQVFTDLIRVNAGTNFNSWLVGVHFKDVLSKGNTAGLIFGQPLSRSSVSGLAVRPENATPYHLEGYFNYRLNDKISITPGVFMIFNPEGVSSNRTAIVPVIRTTFSF